MPECRNCGGFVTENYVQVFAPPGIKGVRVCPNCEGTKVRSAPSPRH